MKTRSRLLVFVTVFIALWIALKVFEPFGRWFIEDLTVPLAVWALNLIGLAGEPVRAAGSRIAAEGGGLNVLQGCEGLDVLGLWIAAIAAGPFTWRGRWLGWTLGLVLVFGLNQLRLFSLFDIYRTKREMFGDAHGLWWPLALVVAVFLLYALWQRLFGSDGEAGAAAPRTA